MDLFIMGVSSSLGTYFCIWWLWRILRGGLGKVGISIPEKDPATKLILALLNLLVDVIFAVLRLLLVLLSGPFRGLAALRAKRFGLRPKRKLLTSWWEPFGEASTFSIAVSGASHSVVLESQPCRGCECLGRLLVDGKVIPMNWERYDSSTGNLGTSTENFFWPRESVDFPCTGLTELLKRAEVDAEARAPIFVAKDGDLLLNAGAIDVGEGQHELVYSDNRLEIEVSPAKGRGRYTHYKSVDSSQ